MSERLASSLFLGAIYSCSRFAIYMAFTARVHNWIHSLSKGRSDRDKVARLACVGLALLAALHNCSPRLSVSSSPVRAAVLLLLDRRCGSNRRLVDLHLRPLPRKGRHHRSTDFLPTFGADTLRPPNGPSCSAVPPRTACPGRTARA